MSNIGWVEMYDEVLSAGLPMDSGGASGWLMPGLNSLAGDITAAIMREVEEYAQPGDDVAARAVRRVAHNAVAGFTARIASANAATEPGAPGGAEPPELTSAANMFHDLGRLLAFEGRSLGALHAALRVGARVTWQRLQEQARRGNGNPEAFAHIGEAVYWYMDELGASCSAGYAEARAELAGETSQRRRHLLNMLISSPAPPAAAIASLARAAGWPLPRRVAAVALAPLTGSNPMTLPPDVLADLSRRDPCLLVVDPDGPGRRRQLATALTGWLTTVGQQSVGQQSVGQLAAVGPAVPLTEASRSLRWASQALGLARRGLIRVGPGGADAGQPGGGAEGTARIVWCEDHLSTLVLLADPDLAAVLSRDALAPLRPLRAIQADRLGRTLLAWMESADDANAAARRLHVHPQTIRYRLRQLSELFGDALIDQDARFRLQLALRVRLLLDGS
jgi:PucR C-terminal helix-turn-helix domain